MPRNLHSFCASNLHTCPQSCTVGHAFPGKAVPHLAYWNGMVEIKTRGPRWNNAERQSARRVTCRLSHVRESKQRHGSEARKRARLFPLLLYHLLSTRTLPFWTIFFGVLSPILRRKRRASFAPAVTALH